MCIFEELIEKLRVHQVSNFRPWLYTYARNYCLMELRKKPSEVSLEISQLQLMENASPLHPFYEEDIREDQLTRLEACVAALNKPQQECVRLFFIEKKCYKEIANSTGFTLKQVKSYIQNGKRNIRICMEKKHE